MFSNAGQQPKITNVKVTAQLMKSRCYFSYFVYFHAAISFLF